jgi:hypothetical protein
MRVQEPATQLYEIRTGAPQSIHLQPDPLYATLHIFYIKNSVQLNVLIYSADCIK